MEGFLRSNLRVLRGIAALTLLFGLLAMCSGVPPAGAEQPTAIKNVLILFPQEGWYAPATRTIYHEIKSVFDESPNHHVFLLDENLDLYLFSDETSLWPVGDFINKKYSNTRIDLVIPVTRMSLDFVLRFRGSLFSKAPIVYCAEVAQGGKRLQHGVDLTGTAVTLDISGTIELARKILPGLKRLAVVAGTSVIDEYMVSIFHEGFKGFGGQLELIDLAGRPMGLLLEQVSRLPASTCIMYLNLRRDGDGRIFSSADTQKLISATANVPLFNLFDTSLGYGSVGGRLTSLATMARKTGEIAMRVLSGESAASIEPVVISENPAMFDWRELRRWGIEERALPPGSTVHFRESSYWERHRWWVIGIFALICLQSLFMFVLLSNLIRRKRAEEEAARTRHNLAHVARISTVGQLGQSLAHEINQPLAAIRVNAEVASKLVQSETPDLGEVQAALVDIVADSKRAQEVVASIRDLVKNKPMKHARIELNQVAADALRVVQADAESKGVAIRLELADDLPTVSGDAVQLQQVVLNLLLNAVESVSENPAPPRRVTVRTGREEGGKVSLCVLDNGPGIDVEIAKRLFEPFFSTKANGLGLGLSICRSIAEAHGGSLGIVAGMQAGAAFCLNLPAGSTSLNKRPPRGVANDG